MSSPESTALDSDQTFEILSNQRRRMVLYYLRQHDGTAVMNELAEQIAAWENDIPIDELESQERKRVYVSLYQTHLPKLADTSLIEYDDDEGSVRLADQATEMDAFLTSKGTSEYSFRRHYLGLSIIGGGMIALAVFATPVLGLSTLVLLASIVLTGYLATAGVEYWYYQKQQSEIPSELEPPNP